MQPGSTFNTGVDDDERQALRVEGLDPDDPAHRGDRPCSMGTLALRLSHRTRPTEIGKQQNWMTYALRPDRYGFVNVRDGTVIDSELRLRARLFRRSIREHGGEPSSRRSMNSSPSA